MARMYERPILLSLAGKNATITEPGSAVNIELLDLLFGRLLELYSGKECLAEA